MNNVSQANAFNLTAAQVEYQKLACEFASRELKGQSAKFDRDAAVASDLLKRMSAAGLINVRLPEAYGGLGLNTFEACLIAEELACGCSGVAGISEASEMAIMPVIQWGSQPQKETLLTPLAAEQDFAGLSLSFFETEYAPLKAVRQANHFILTGTADRVANGSLAKWVLVEAEVVEEKESKAPARQGNWAAFCLPGDAAGVKTTASKALLGRRASDITSIECDKVKLAQDFRLDSDGKREAFVAQLKRLSFPLIAAGCVGVAKAALAHATTYAGQRQTFGKPIAQHQGVAFMLADMARAIEAARLLMWRAAKACDAEVEGETLGLAALAYAQEMAMSVTTDAVQIFGGYGYSKEYPVEKLMRDAKAYQLFGGTPFTAKGALGRFLLKASIE
jgi:acyl-CoA dehydrogenase